MAEASSDKAAGGKGRWIKDSIGVLYVVDDRVQFADDFEHLANGFCRLLEVPEEQIKKLVEEWVEICRQAHGQLPDALAPEERSACLKQAVVKVMPIEGNRLTELGEAKDWGCDFSGNIADTVYAGSISGNLSRAVVGRKEDGFAWLVDPAKRAAVPAGSIEYDTAYFDNKPAEHYGMKQYLQHTDWRMQKARRFANHMLAVSGKRANSWLENPSAVSLLDIGSATGLFRAAVEELGFAHFGIDVSADAAAHCLENFSFETWLGSLFDVDKYVVPGQKFNIITFWDVIEHLDRHADAVKYIAKFLEEDGIVVIRTPNLEAIEATILGDRYYSYKLDHTSYFSVRSLDALLHLAGLVPIHTETVSHIFKGFLGVQYLYDAGLRLQGADILAVYARPGSLAR